MPRRYRYLALIYRLYPAWPFEEYRIASGLIAKYGCRSVADVGCGPGNLVRFLPDSVERYIGLDINKMFRHRDGRAAFVESDGALPPLRGRVDCAIFVNSIFYIGVDALRAYSELADIIIVVDIDRRYPHVRFFDMLEGSIRLSPGQLEEAARHYGLKPLESGGDVTFYEVYRSYRAKEVTIRS